MKRTLLFILTFMAISVTYGQRTVAADSLRYCADEVITVCHTVSATFCTKTPEKTTFLSFGTFPKHLLTVVIYEEDLKNFSYSPSEFLNGKTICVTGDVVMFDSGPEIIVEQEAQIRVVEE